jgi:hypothetical protein
MALHGKLKAMAAFHWQSLIKEKKDMKNIFNMIGGGQIWH